MYQPRNVPNDAGSLPNFLDYELRNIGRSMVEDFAALAEAIVVVCSDETTALSTGAAKVTFRMPYAFYLTSVKASLTAAQTSGTAFQVDVNNGGTSVLSTKLTIDNNELTSVTAATPAVISAPYFAADAVVTIDIDTCTAAQATGLKVTLIGRKG
jgi:hypothetical protein